MIVRTEVKFPMSKYVKTKKTMGKDLAPLLENLELRLNMEMARQIFKQNQVKLYTFN